MISLRRLLNVPWAVLSVAKCAHEVGEPLSCRADSEAVRRASGMIQRGGSRSLFPLAAEGGHSSITDLDLRGLGVDRVSLASKEPDPNVIGSIASLDEVGYQTVAATCCALAMEEFVRRVILDLGLEICHDGFLMGFIPFFTCEKGIRTFDALKTEILASQPGPYLEKCPFVAQVGTCPTIGPECGVYPDPAYHRRRSCAYSSTSEAIVDPYATTTAGTTTGSTATLATTIVSTTEKEATTTEATTTEATTTVATTTEATTTKATTTEATTTAATTAKATTTKATTTEATTTEGTTTEATLTVATTTVATMTEATTTKATTTKATTTVATTTVATTTEATTTKATTTKATTTVATTTEATTMKATTTEATTTEAKTTEATTTVSTTTEATTTKATTTEATTTKATTTETTTTKDKDNEEVMVGPEVTVGPEVIEDCKLPTGTCDNALIVLNDAKVHGKILGNAPIGVTIGGDLLDGTEQNNGVVGGQANIGGKGIGNWNFNGGKNEGIIFADHFRWSDFETLARTAVSGTYKKPDNPSRDFKVVVYTKGGLYDSFDFRAEGKGELDGTLTLAVFNTKEDIVLGPTSDNRQFGPSVLAPFSTVTVKERTGYTDGFIVAKAFGPTSQVSVGLTQIGGGAPHRRTAHQEPQILRAGEQLEHHGNCYKGPIECNSS